MPTFSNFNNASLVSILFESGSKTDYLRPRLQTGMGLSHAGVYGVVKAAEIDNTCSNGKLHVAQHLTIYKYSLAHELADEYHELSESTDSD